MSMLKQFFDHTHLNSVQKIRVLKINSKNLLTYGQLIH